MTRKFPSLLLDLVTVAAVVAVALWIWPREPGLVAGQAVPWWGAARDLLLDGPDAGEWARNIHLLGEGRLQEMDHHRLPGWMAIVLAVRPLADDLVQGGHLANRLLYLGLGLSTWWLGRLAGGRAVGLGAAVLALAHPHAIQASQRFGVDAAVAGLLPLTLATALLAVRAWPFAILSGLVCGFVSAVHYTTLPYTLPALVVIAVGQRGRARWAALGLHALNAALVLRLWMVVYPVPSLEALAADVVNGIAPGGQAGQAGHGSAAVSWSILQGGLAQALPGTVSRVLALGMPPGVPWSVGLLLPWIGLVGLGLRPAGDGVWWRRLGRTVDLPAGVGLALSLAPLPLLVAVQAPVRYGDNLVAFAAVLVLRGLVGPVQGVAGAVWSRLWPAAPWPGLLALALVAVLLRPVLDEVSDRRGVLRPEPYLVDQLVLGRALARHFPPGDAVACPGREALFYADLAYCPDRICPKSAAPQDLVDCLGVHAERCTGESVGYVVTEDRLFYDPNAPDRVALDALVTERWPPVETIAGSTGLMTIHVIPREDLAALVGSP